MDFSSRFRVKPRRRGVLAQCDPDDTADIKRTDAALQLTASVARLSTALDVMYAQNAWSVLLILQAMDAAGKDGTIKHVFTGVNPRSVRIVSFGAPSAEELDHDYLWRIVRALPERGCVGVHNRSHYEDVLVTRVHPQILERQHLPAQLKDPGVIGRRFKEINRFEKYLVDNGTIVLKFFLHVSKHEQWQRLVERMEEPEKYWKAQAHDLHERALWPEYMAAYDDIFAHTSTPHAPWYVVPADHKWFAWLVVAEVLNQTLAGLKLEYPHVPDAIKLEWQAARDQLKKL